MAETPSADPPANPTSDLRLWLRWVAIVLVAAEVVWLVVANLLLAGPLSRWLSHSPEKTEVVWESAWSAYPTHLRVRNLSIRTQSRRMQMEIVVGEANGRLGLLPLLGRRIAIRGATGSGVAVRSRHRLDATDRFDHHAAHMPPIRGLDNPPQEPPVRKRRQPPVWVVSFEDLGWVEGEEIWIDAFRVGPGLRVRGSAEIVPREHYVLSDLEAVLDGVEITSFGEPLAGGLTGRGHLALSPIAMKEALPAGEPVPLPLDDADLELEIDGTMAAAPLAGLLTGGLGWFAVEGGGGELSARLAVDDGRLRDGSRVDLMLPDLVLRVTEFRLRGAAECSFRLATEEDGAPGEASEGDGWLLAIDGSGLTAESLDPAVRLLRAESFGVRLRGADDRLSSYRRAASLAVRLSGGVIDDLTPWEAYVPAKTGIELVSGHGTVEARLDADVEGDRGSAAADVRLSGVVVDYFGERVAGGADVALRLPVLALAERRYALGGSEVTLTGDGMEPPWEGSFLIEEGWLTPGRDPAARLAAEIEASDARPAIALYLARSDLPEWIGGLIRVESLSGETDLALGPGGLDLGPFVLTGDRAHVEGVLTLRDRNPDGLVYARYRGLQVGLRVDGEERHVRLASPRQWYEKWLEER